jgi:23S rRNA (cytosine1962-C5)-methyltransferase
MDERPVINLARGRERSVRRHHPWIFSGSVAEVHGNPQPGDTVEVTDHEGAWLARAAYSPQSKIRARIWTWDPERRVDEEFVRQRIDQAVSARQGLPESGACDAYREVFAESDGFPGLIVDRYRDFRVLQFLSTGAERWRDVVADALASSNECRGVYERSDVDVRELEGLPLRKGLLRGEMPPETLTIEEHGLRFAVDLMDGQKTGFYLDQRENRNLVRQALHGGEVLDCFCYTGGFTIAALAAGASKVHSIDSSAASLALARRNVALNGCGADRCQFIAGDVFSEMRSLRDRGQSFDAVILDPPRFAPTAAHAPRAARAYKDINLLAFKLLKPGGLLATFSCSGGVGPEIFEKIVAGAAVDAGVEARILTWLSQPADHPVSLSFPEGRYLKGLVCRVDPC